MGKIKEAYLKIDYEGTETNFSKPTFLGLLEIIRGFNATDYSKTSITNEHQTIFERPRDLFDEQLQFRDYEANAV